MIPADDPDGDAGLSPELTETWRGLRSLVTDRLDEYRRLVVEATGLPFSRARALRRLTAGPLTHSALAEALPLLDADPCRDTAGLALATAGRHGRHVGRGRRFDDRADAFVAVGPVDPPGDGADHDVRGERLDRGPQRAGPLIARQRGASAAEVRGGSKLKS